MNKLTISINGEISVPSVKFDQGLLSDITWYPENFASHIGIADEIRDKHPYTATILIKPLRYDLSRKKEYVHYTKIPISNLYQEILFKKFDLEYGQLDSNNLYAIWLDKYHSSWQKLGFESIDSCIMTKELEPRYKNEIISKYKNHQRLFRSRFKYEIERYYRLPKPTDWIDWRTPYDNLFIWKDCNTKYARRGGCGSSQAREINSKFIYALLTFNKEQPIPSYWFLYSEDNRLLFIKRFSSLTVPDYDIGSNYSIDPNQDKKLRQNGQLIRWNNWMNFSQLTTS